MDKQQNARVEDKKQGDVVVKIEKLCKNYKMFDRKTDRLIEAVIPGIERHKVFKALDGLDLEIKKGEVLGNHG